MTDNVLEDERLRDLELRLLSLEQIVLAHLKGHNPSFGQLLEEFAKPLEDAEKQGAA